ncbi:hypothetical protein [Sphingobacterium siyangense]|nr:hypothetical protein [Sphingobacterium siyangense]
MNLFMLAAVVIAGVTMSFKMASTSTVYHYDSESTAAGAFATVGNWQPGTSSEPCGTGEDKPCQITAENAMDLQSKLNGKTNPQVLAIVDSKRE